MECDVKEEQDSEEEALLVSMDHNILNRRGAGRIKCIMLVVNDVLRPDCSYSSKCLF